jgi:type IV pilus assembly protein PilW
MRQADTRARSGAIRRTSARRQSGMSIVELMVATVISLVGVLVIFQVFAVNEGVRRGTTAGSDEQTSGLLGLMLLERELRHAGFGINDLSAIGCNMKMWDNNASPKDVTAFPLSAVQIESKTGSTPDVLRVIYRGTPPPVTPPPPPINPVAVKLSIEMSDQTSPFKLQYLFGFLPGDVVLVSGAGVDCTLREVTATPSLGMGGVELQHQSGTYTNGYTGESQTARFNKAAGTPVIYQAAAKVQNLGPAPVRNEITVRNGETNPAQNNQLVLTNMLGDSSQVLPVAEQIVQLKAEYGMDDSTNNNTITRAAYNADDNIVDNYTKDSPTTAADWQRVRSVRIAIVSRSQVAERPNAGTTCDATPDWGSAQYPVRWARGPDSPQGRPIDVRTGPDWRCYKYKVYETTVPLRNMLWRQA